MADSEDAKNKREEFLLIYKATFEEIRYTKNRQWAVTYYGLLTFAAIIGFVGVVKDVFVALCLTQSILIMFPALVVNIGSFVIIMDVHTKLCKHRKRLTAIEKTFQNDTKQLVKSGPADPGLDRYYFPFPILFVFLIFIGLFFVGWILFGSYLNPFWLFCIIFFCDAVFFFFLYRRHKKALDKVVNRLETSGLL